MTADATLPIIAANPKCDGTVSTDILKAISNVVLVVVEEEEKKDNIEVIVLDTNNNQTSLIIDHVAKKDDSINTTTSTTPPPCSSNIKSVTTTKSTIKNKEVRNSNKRNATTIAICKYARSICILSLEMLLLITFVIYISFYTLEIVENKYLLPQLQLMNFIYNPVRAEQELTYYHRTCNVHDLTTADANDLLLETSNNISTNDAIEHMLTHGASVYPNILSSKTSNEVRDYILTENKKQENFDVIEGKNRYSFGIQVNDNPVIPKALHEIITNNPLFISALEGITGTTNPAIIEFTAITSTYGAVDQYLHHDVLPSSSAAKYGKTFSPPYSLFIALQNTTKEMGSTQVCPGSHVCSDGELVDMCTPIALLSIADANNNGIWEQGTGALLNQQIVHRGTSHTDGSYENNRNVNNDSGNNNERVLLIITFTPRPQFDDEVAEASIISQGGSYSMHWTNWGHTLNDFKDASTTMLQPWITLRTLGLYKGNKQQWGWDYISVASMRISNGDTGYATNDLEFFLLNLKNKIKHFNDVNSNSSSIDYYYHYCYYYLVSLFLPEKWLIIEEGGMKLREQQIIAAAARSSSSIDGNDEKTGNNNNIAYCWYDFLSDTVKNCKSIIGKFNIIIFIIYILVIKFIDILKIIVRLHNNIAGNGDVNNDEKQKKQGDDNNNLPSLKRRCTCLLITHGIIYFLAQLYLHKLHNTKWAKNIINGKAYRPSFVTSNRARRKRKTMIDFLSKLPPLTDGNTTATITATTIINDTSNNGGGTLPNAEDVLIVSKHYFKNYNIIDFTQPGNILWKTIVQDHTKGINAELTLSMQKELCYNMIQCIQNKDSRGRFLVKLEATAATTTDQGGAGGQWIELSHENTIQFCIKELIMESNNTTILKIMLEKIDQLILEQESTSLSSSMSPPYYQLSSTIEQQEYLIILQNTIFLRYYGNNRFFMPTTTNNNIMIKSSKNKKKSYNNNDNDNIRSVIPRHQEEKEQQQQQESVNSLFLVINNNKKRQLCKMNKLFERKIETRKSFKWAYERSISNSSSSSSSSSSCSSNDDRDDKILFDSKNEPFPGAWFAVGDEIEAMLGGRFNEWYLGKIIYANSDQGTYDIAYEDGDVDRGLYDYSLRSFIPYEYHEQVEARVKGENIYVPGVIVHIHCNNKNKNKNKTTSKYYKYSYDIKTKYDGIQKQVLASDIRRRKKFLKDTQVEVYNDDGLWYKGKIIDAHYIEEDFAYDYDIYYFEYNTFGNLVVSEDIRYNFD